MNVARPLLSIAAGALLLFTAGCASNRPFRTSLVPCDTTQTNVDCAKSAIETTPDYKLGFVEFDDQGWFWDREQLRVVEKMVETEAGIGQTNNPQGIVIVLFAHGWKNNAAYDNEGVKTCRVILGELNKAEQNQSGPDQHTPRKILGVYAGWRGLSAEW